MKVRLPAAMIVAAVMIPCGVRGQQKAAKSESPAQLELSVEVAATTDEGYPSALRITISNVGSVAVDMPVLKRGCSPDNGIQVQSVWIPDSPTAGEIGSGGGCIVGVAPSLRERLQNDWIRLRPSEFMTDTERVQWNYPFDAGGTVEYWVEFYPPIAPAKELDAVTDSGFVIPTRRLETEHSSFHVP
jgi:hypothetical protein